MGDAKWSKSEIYGIFGVFPALSVLAKKGLRQTGGALGLRVHLRHFDPPCVKLGLFSNGHIFVIIRPRV